MVSLMELWLPIVLSAVAVFAASSIIHMVLGYHNSDYKKLPGEDRRRRRARLLLAPSLHRYEDHGLSGNDGEIQSRTGWLDVLGTQGAARDGKAARNVVCLLPPGRHLRRLHGQPNSPSRCSLSGGLPHHRHHCLPRLWSLRAHRFNLEESAVERDDQTRLRWAHLCLADRWCFRLAVAVI